MEIALFAVIIVILAIIAWRLWNSQPKQEVNGDIAKLTAQLETSNTIWADQLKKLRDELSQSREKESATRDASTGRLIDQIEKFTGRFGEMKTELEGIEKDVKDISSFQTIFKNPKLTGEWGEMALDYLLAQYFPRKDAFESQKLFLSGEKVDFALKLPDDRILPIDSKFPQDIFGQFIRAENDKEKEVLRKTLVVKVKKDIDDIATKYILPNEGTVDLAVMYIPAESLYYEIISKEDLSTYAWAKRVVIASPNNLILILQIIIHWFKKADIGKKADIILKKLQRIKKDGDSLADSFRKLGGHITDAKSSWDDTDKRLNFLVGRVDDATELISEDEVVVKELDQPKNPALKSTANKTNAGQK
jgi:DNA recombination protein RmuC